MELFNINNGCLDVTISSFGAEIHSIYSLISKEEYVWEADPAYWGRHAPILFPIIGELKNGCYFYNNKEYKMPKHGFARDSIFELVDHDEAHSITFRLLSNSSLLSCYPFDFSLYVTYCIKGNELVCTYKIMNMGHTDMFYNIGGHPAFSLPNKKDFTYFLYFDQDVAINRFFIEGGLLSPKSDNVSLPNGRLALTDDLFDQDAWVIKKLNTHKIVLHNQFGVARLSVEFQDFEQLGLWAPPKTPFICIEPWCGYNDERGSNQNLVDKKGISILKPKSESSKSWSIQILN